MDKEKKKDVDWGKRLQSLRVGRGLSQKELAASEIGISLPTIQRYEAGELPGAKGINEIIQYFKCSKAWLLTGEGLPYQDKLEIRPDNSNNIVYLNTATRILDGAIADAGVILNDAQKTALIKIIQEELDSAASRAGNKAKEIINVFKKED